MTPPKGSKVKYLNFAITKAIINIFAEILHAGGVAIDMKHIKRDFSLKALVGAPWVDLGGGAEAKIKLFQNMVMLHIKLKLIAQSVTCLATDASLTADPGVASSILALSHTFVEIDHEIISTVILLPSAESFKKGCCQLQAKVCARSTG